MHTTNEQRGALEIKHFEKIDSTNDYALRFIQSEIIQTDTAIIAERQTCGRGRLNGRTWESPHGNFYCSYIINLETLNITLMAANTLTHSVLYITGEYLRNQTGSNLITLKQPNDILVRDKKLAGVLTETSYPYAVIGIGINLTNSPIGRATDIRREFNLIINPTDMAKNLYKFLWPRLKQCYAN